MIENIVNVMILAHELRCTCT